MKIRFKQTVRREILRCYLRSFPALLAANSVVMNQRLSGGGGRRNPLFGWMSRERVLWSAVQALEANAKKEAGCSQFSRGWGHGRDLPPWNQTLRIRENEPDEAPPVLPSGAWVGDLRGAP